MKTHRFDVVLKDVTEVTDEQADSLVAASCHDGTAAWGEGLAWIHFDCEAASLEEAIRSAIAQVKSAGLSVVKVELDADSAVSLGA